MRAVVYRGVNDLRLETVPVPRIRGGELLVLGSTQLTTQFAAAGVLDELRIMVCPIAIGQGRSLFQDLDGRLALRLARVRPFDSGNVLLTYRLPS